MAVVENSKLVGVSECGRRVGEYSPTAKLLDSDVDLIFELRQHGLGYRRLADKFGVSKALVRAILSGRRRATAVARFIRVRKSD